MLVFVIQYTGILRVKGWDISGSNVLPVVEITVSLGSLGTEVGQVAGEQEVVLGGDGKRVAHEGSGVDDQSTGHGTGDTAGGIESVMVLFKMGISFDGRSQQKN